MIARIEDEYIICALHRLTSIMHFTLHLFYLVSALCQWTNKLAEESGEQILQG